MIKFHLLPYLLWTSIILIVGLGQNLCLECKDYLSSYDCENNGYLKSYCTWTQPSGPCEPLNTTANPINEYYQFQNNSWVSCWGCSEYTCQGSDGVNLSFQCYWDTSANQSQGACQGVDLTKVGKGDLNNPNQTSCEGLWYLQWDPVKGCQWATCENEGYTSDECAATFFAPNQVSSLCEVRNKHCASMGVSITDGHELSTEAECSQTIFGLSFFTWNSTAEPSKCQLCQGSSISAQEVGRLFDPSGPQRANSKSIMKNGSSILLSLVVLILIFSLQIT